MNRVLVLGGTGAVGRHVVRLLAEQGRVVRVLTRGRGNADVRGVEWHTGDALRAGDVNAAMKGVDAVVSALGASVSLREGGRTGYLDVDVPAHRHVVEAARDAGVSRMIYVSVHVEQGYEHTRYVQAHVAVEAMIRAAGIPCTMVRPTGVFTALEEFVGMAARGMASVIGDGSARTNPVHAACVAEQCVRHLREGPDATSVGGPDVLTRRQIAEAAFSAVGRSPRIMRVPPGMMRASGTATRLFNARLGDLLEFAAAVSVTDCVAPTVGTRRLADHFRAVALAQGVVSAASPTTGSR